MISSCPICSSKNHQPVVSLAETPVFESLPGGEEVTPQDFAPLSVVRCDDCGHLYNRAYQVGLEELMYRGDALTNVPVHSSMTQNIEKIADWLGVEQYSGKNVIEIGAGSGYLARVLARTAKTVQVFEPSRGLQPAMLPEENIRLVPDLFDPALAEGPVDLITCRHVLEHVDQPGKMLQGIREILEDDGYLYLEVPSAEYIEEHAAIYDFQIPHVQYFHQPNLLALAARAGLAAEKQWSLKGGHDYGVLLRPQNGVIDENSSGPARTNKNLGEHIQRRVQQGRDALAELDGRMALYGANSHALAFLNWFQSDREFEFASDDNMDNAGRFLYGKEQTVPICEPSKTGFSGIDVVVITAYLHSTAILERLVQLDYRGEVVVIEPEISPASIGAEHSNLSTG